MSFSYRSNQHRVTKRRTYLSTVTFTNTRAIMGKPVRLHVKGVHLGFKRNRRNQHEQQSRLQLEGVQDRGATAFYVGKRVAYMYKAPPQSASQLAS
eukprot:IDg18978t1